MDMERLGNYLCASKTGEGNRARAVSGYILFGYLGFGLPGAVVGFFSDRYGIFGSLVGFGGFITLASLVLAVSSKPGTS